jgi:hypothetical protein
MGEPPVAYFCNVKSRHWLRRQADALAEDTDNDRPALETSVDNEWLGEFVGDELVSHATFEQRQERSDASNVWVCLSGAPVRGRLGGEIEIRDFGSLNREFDVLDTGVVDTAVKFATSDINKPKRFYSCVRFA